ncbi:S-adenosylmethionine:tRNA ribosyltransferase-isomerase [uncultured Sanguibacteroides sp.]|uniref:S-adenosylmethionine:tRNA ribosyltransferase-isomerase n=1 Tax=uncultured Sanguibacteroides sp. TaxID=1635151 RepID=UPI0025F071B1|nr:S-adenosylmethionine:tRNA ribosyltransferase-isomerase [uncultured Sanguibacteroides sp.]
MLEELKGIRIEEYTYDLPDERIAKFPLENRDASKLLVYEEGKIRERHFNEVPDMLNAGQTLIFNNTKVIYARILFQKVTGAAIEVFCLEPYLPADYVQNFAAVRSCEWKCMVGNLKKWKEGIIVCRYHWDGVEGRLKATRVKQEENDVIVRFEWDDPISFSEVLEHCGKIPIPPYLNRDSEENDKIRYQTVYSKNEGSVAAPTAGLHFSISVLDRLRAKGIMIEELTLHVGAGTFKPVKSETIGEHSMHTEHISIQRELVEHLYEYPDDIIAVGTTSVRSLESLYWMGVKRLEGDKNFNILGQWEVYTLPRHYSLREAMASLLQWYKEQDTEMLKAQTTIIIVPGYRFRVISSMFTNFHQPQSTLLLLVAAAIGEDWKKVYRYALEHDFRFLSYGDSSFLKIKE